MKKVVLFINDFYTTQEVTEMICYGLGSCIGLFIQDRSMKITSGAHIPVVKSNKKIGFKSAEQIISEMFCQLTDLGSDLKSLRAKITGGASLYENFYGVGAENIKVIKELLISNKVFLAAQDTGGHVARTAHFNSFTGECQIHTASQQKYII
ncbi:MAG: chemotaxis protein CheD [Bacteroidota bacterium]